ncbi:MAG: presenilin family intramembrane aspartyl protease [Dehalococcoidales bacterium]|nr:presenilin family intramembrane aspartyl protease [Dehalococcoidales bacterium]
MNLKKYLKFNPVHWGLILFLVTHVLVLLVVTRMDPFFEEQDIYVPSQPSGDVIWWPGEITTPSGEIVEAPAYSSAGPVIIYIVAVAVILGLVLFFIPLWALKILLRVLFAALFGWGAFVISVFYLPYQAAIAIAVILGIVWFAKPFVWLHNLALVASLAAVASVFGRFISPWTAMIIILALAVYDFLAVRFGFMTWMADRLAKSDTLPAIVIPKDHSGWNLNLKKEGITDILEPKSEARSYSILGGGDIAFPGLLTAAVYFSQGLVPAITIAVFGFGGLVLAYIIQAVFLKGRAMPALPPIAALAMIGLLII